MKIWFGATSHQIEQYITYYQKIRDFLVKINCVVVFDWIDEAYAYKLKSPGGNRGIKDVYHKVITAIETSDASVIEYTVPNFSSSHQIMYSLLKRKPTLVMRLKKDNSFSDSYLDAVESPYLIVKEYNLDTYQAILNEFIGESRIENGSGRYNVVLEKKHKYYLDWISAKLRQSRSEVVRQSLDRSIEADEEYRKYLLKL